MATKIWLGIFILLTPLALFSQESQNTIPVNSTPLSVDYAVGISPSAEDVNQVIVIGQRMLQQAHVSTIVPLYFRGLVGNINLSLTNGAVNNCGEIDKLFALKNADVHIVSEIHCCGGPKGGIVGCAGLGTPLIVLPPDRNRTASRAIQWMHEFGHRMGLCHRDITASTLMNSCPNSGRKDISPCERDALEGKGLSGDCQSYCGVQSQCGGQLNQLRILALVHQNFIEGVPYQANIEYTNNEFSELVHLLNDPRKEALWAKAVTVLGMTGDPAAFDLLRSFLERDTGSISSSAYAAKLDVPIALGYLLKKTENPEILKYLIKGLRPSAWSGIIKWQSPPLKNEADRDAHLATVTMLGLALSGHTKGLTALQNLLNEFMVQKVTRLQDASAGAQNKCNNGPIKTLPEKFEEGTAALLSEAIRTSQRVHDVGLVQYYHEYEIKQLGFNP